MKTIASTVFLIASLFVGVSAASARPDSRDSRSHGSWNDGNGEHDGYDDRFDQTALDQRWDDFDDHAAFSPEARLRELIRSGHSLRQIRRMMFRNTTRRIDARAAMIHSRLGYSRDARFRVQQMRSRELQRFEARMNWVAARYARFAPSRHERRHSWR